jgi:hypothetical protein
MQFSPTSCLFIPLWSKYSPQHPVLKHPHVVIFKGWKSAQVLQSFVVTICKWSIN